MELGGVFGRPECGPAQQSNINQQESAHQRSLLGFSFLFILWMCLSSHLYLRDHNRGNWEWNWAASLEGFLFLFKLGTIPHSNKKRHKQEITTWASKQG